MFRTTRYQNRGRWPVAIKISEGQSFLLEMNKDVAVNMKEFSNETIKTIWVDGIKIWERAVLKVTEKAPSMPLGRITGRD